MYVCMYPLLLGPLFRDTNRWRDILCSWIGRINIVKMNMLYKSIYRFIAIPTKLPIAFFMGLEQKVLRFL